MGISLDVSETLRGGGEGVRRDFLGCAGFAVAGQRGLGHDADGRRLHAGHADPDVSIRLIDPEQGLANLCGENVRRAVGFADVDLVAGFGQA